MEVRMTNPFDEFAALVGRVLANRWLREQQSRPAAHHDTAETQPGATTQRNNVGREQLDQVPTSPTHNVPDETLAFAKFRRSLRHN